MMHPSRVILCLASLMAGFARAESPPVRVVRGDGIVEMDNGLLKVCFATRGSGLQQQYLAACGTEWVLMAEGYRPPVDEPQGSASLYNSSIDPQHRLLTTELLQSVTVQEVDPALVRAVLQARAGRRRSSKRSNCGVDNSSCTSKSTPPWPAARRNSSICSHRWSSRWMASWTPPTHPRTSQPPIV